MKAGLKLYGSGMELLGGDTENPVKGVQMDVAQNCQGAKSSTAKPVKGVQMDVAQNGSRADYKKMKMVRAFYPIILIPLMTKMPRLI